MTHRLYKTMSSESKCPKCCSKVTKGYGFASEDEVRNFLSKWGIADISAQNEFVAGLIDYGTEHEPVRYNRHEVYERVRKINGLMLPVEIAEEMCIRGTDTVRTRIKEHGIEAVDYPLQGRFYRREEIAAFMENLGLLKDNYNEAE